jgi:hypothetical protein
MPTASTPEPGDAALEAGSNPPALEPLGVAGHPPDHPERARSSPAPKLEPQWRAIHRVRSGLVLTVVVVGLGLVLAACIGLAVTAAVLAINHAASSSTGSP